MLHPDRRFPTLGVSLEVTGLIATWIQIHGWGWLVRGIDMMPCLRLILRWRLGDRQAKHASANWLPFNLIILDYYGRGEINIDKKRRRNFDTYTSKRHMGNVSGISRLLPWDKRIQNRIRSQHSWIRDEILANWLGFVCPRSNNRRTTSFNHSMRITCT